MSPPRDPLSGFHPLLREWFLETFQEPSPPQREGWPAIARGEHTLILAPTGSGKTLAAFYAAIDDLVKRLESGTWSGGVHTLYVSPLKALNNDVHRNLQVPLVGLAALAKGRGTAFPEVGIGVRTGDTPQRDRARMARNPPHLLITTPESLYLLLLSRARETLRSVRYVVVDEIHAVAGTKRGAHLALSLERLSALSAAEPVRVGLSATQRPLEEVARYLGGYRDDGTPRPVTLVDAGRGKVLDLAVHVPVPDLSDLGGEGLWPHLYPELLALAREHRTTLVFANARRLAERVAARLNALALDPEAKTETQRDRRNVDVVPGFVPDKRRTRQWGFEFARAHHGSMSKEARLEMEGALKEGLLPVLVATGSLELGIDVGHIDCVALLESPKSVSRALQRVGRAGHVVGEASKGRFYPLHRSDVVECAALVRAMRAGAIEETRAPRHPLDVLAQQIVGAVAAEPTSVETLWALVRRAHSYRDLPRTAFDEVLEMLAGKYPAEAFRHLRARLSWDRARGLLTALPGAKPLASANPGTIPDRGHYGCYLMDRTTRIGELDEEFVYETRAGDVFLLGSQSWRVVEIDRDRVVVEPAPGEPPRMPFWRGEGVWRSRELSREVAAVRREVVARLGDGAADEWLVREAACDANAAANVAAHLARMKEETGVVPSDRLILVESFRDELGDPRLAIHAPFGGRVLAPWALVLAARLRSRVGTDVQASFDDEGILFRFPDAEAPPPTDVVAEARADDVERLLLEEVASSPLFAARFRENAERALLLPKPGPGRRQPLWLQRLRAADLLEVARKLPGFPILVETYRDLLSDVFDVEGLREALRGLESGAVEVRVTQRDVPSPFAANLLFGFARNFFYEGDAARPESRAGLLSIHRELLTEVLDRADLRRLLRPDAVAAVESDLLGRSEGSRARTPEELHALLLRAGPLADDEAAAASADAGLPARLLESGRAVRDVTGRLAAIEDPPRLDAARRGDGETARALVARDLRARGPVTVEEVAARLALPEGEVTRALERLAGEGAATSGEFLPGGSGREWCDRENLARIHRKTLALLRQDVKPVPLAALLAVLLRRHGLVPPLQAGSPARLLETLALLRGLALPGEAWERDVLSRRFRRYDPQWMAPLLLAGEVAWVGAGERGRFSPILAAQGRAFLPPQPPEPAGDAGGAVLAVLARDGASFFSDLRAATGLDPAALAATLQALMAKGLVTNDASEVVRLLLRVPRLRAGPSRSRRRAARTALKNPLWIGRWSAARTPRLLGPERSSHDLAEEAARALLGRYGVVSREALERETLGVAAAEVISALKRLEMRGEARRGHFVEGLSGLQFALPDVVEALRAAPAAAPGEEVALLLGACDPVTFALPPLRDPAGEEVRPPRSPSTHLVVTTAGRPLLASEGFGARLTPLAGATEADLVAACKLVGGLAELPAGLRPRRRILVEAWAGRAPTVSPEGRRILSEAGFETEAGKMVYHRAV